MSSTFQQRVQLPYTPIFNPYTKSLQPPSSSHSSPPILHQPHLEPTDDPLDNSWIGERIHSSPKGFRFLLQNPNGLNTNNKLIEFGLLLENIKRYKIDMLLLPESNINSHNHVLLDQMRSATELHLHSPTFCTNNTPNFPPSTYQPGGVTTIHHDNLTTRTSPETFHDPVGRWTCSVFNGKVRKLKVYCLYRVCMASDPGPTTAFSQQEQFFLDQDQIVNPRTKVISDLIEVLRSDITSGVDVLLAGDFNEALDGTTASQLQDLGLSNVLETYLESCPRTYKYGSQCIDHIWVSNTILPTVTSVGIAPFNFFQDSDHRAIYVDMDLKDIIDNDSFHIPPIRFRRLKTTSLSSVASYKKSIRKLTKKHRISKKFRRIRRAFTKYGPTSSNISKLNKFDKLITKILLDSERQCSKVTKKCKTPWSPTLKQAIKDYSRAKRKVRILRKRSSSTPDIIKRAIQKRSETRRHLNEVTKNADDYRKQFLMQQAEVIANRRDTTVESEYQNLIRYEELRNSFSKIRYIHSGQRSGAVSAILIPDIANDTTPFDIETMWQRIEPHNGKDIPTWQRVDDKEQIESLLLGWMGRHNSQASDTPLASDTWQDHLQDHISRHQIHLGNLDQFTFEHPEVREFLQTFSQNNSPPIPFQYSFQRFTAYIKKAKEKLSSSPSGRHMGHYKALLDMNDTSLLQIIYEIMELCMKHTIILERFALVALTLLEKDLGSPKIHRLRPIALVETELNCIAKAHWAQDLMQHIEKTKTLSDDQYGGRSRRQAQSAVLNKVLYFDIQKQLAEPAIFIDKDARNCFDRFIPSLISLENETLGSPPLASHFMETLLRRQHIQAKTIYGLTSQAISDVSQLKHFGSGQGIGWSGQACCASLNSVSKAMATNCISLSFTSPDRTTQVKTMGDCFVDDTELGINFEASDHLIPILEQAQHTDQRHTLYWNTSGGKVACDKSSWYYIDFVFINGKPKLLRKDALPGEIKTKPHFNSAPVTVPRLEVSQAHKTLGCWVAADGSQTAQFDVLSTLATAWANKNRTSGLSPKEILMSYYSRLLPQLSYRLVITNFSYKQCDSIMSSVMPVLINAFHIQRHFSYDIAQAPPRYGGLNLQHIYYTLLHLKSQKYIYHIRQMDKTGKLLKISSEFTQLQLGSATPFFSLPSKLWSHLVTPTWVTHLYQLLEHCSIEVTFPTFWCPQPSRLHDQNIMDIFFNITTDVTILAQLNACRLVLQVISLADITSLDGTMILPSVHVGDIHRTSLLRWPRQKVPSHWWHLWSSYLSTYIAPILIHHPLGSWTAKSHQRWLWHKHGPHVFGPNQQTYSLASALTRHHRYTPSPSLPLPPASVPVDVTINNTSLFVISSTPINIPPTPSASAFDFSFLQYHPEFLRQGMRGIVKYLRKGKLLVATDGSAFPGIKASFGFCLAKPSGKVLYRNHGPVWGDKEYLASDRAELTALLSALTFLHQIIDNHVLTITKAITFYTDSKASIALITGSSSRISSTFDNNHDLVLELKNFYYSPKLPLRLVYVKGHQDRKTAYEYLPLPAKLNIQADHTAEQQYSHSIEEHNHNMPHLPSQIISLSNPHGRIVSHFPEELIRFHRDPPTEAKLCKNWNIPPAKLCHVDWEALRKTFLTQSRFSGKLTKTIHQQWDTAARKRSWRMTQNDTCPLCLSCTETTDHVLQCTHGTITEVRKKAQTDLWRSLNDAKTSPEIITAIQDISSSWHSLTPVLTPAKRSHSLQKSIRKAVKSQKRLGISNFFRGIISIKWSSAQAKYCTQSKLKFNPSWSKRLTSSLLSYSHSMWKARCSIVQAEKIGTMENHYRDLALSLFEQHKNHPHHLVYRHRNLLRKSPAFFHQSSIAAVRMWYKKMLSSLEYCQNRSQSIGRDIRNWVTLRPRDPGRNLRGARVPNCSRLFRLCPRSTP